MRHGFFLLVLCAFLSCKKDEFSLDDVCQPNHPEHNSLIESELFYGETYGRIACLTPSPDGNLFYAMSNNEPVDIFTVLVNNDSLVNVDTNKIKDTKFRYEVGLLTKEGYKKKNIYLPGYFVPDQIFPIIEGPRKGEALVIGNYFNIWTPPFDFNSHIFLYNPNTSVLTDLYNGFDGAEISLIFRQETNQYYEYYLRNMDNIFLFQLDKINNNTNIKVIGSLGVSGRGALTLIKNDSLELLYVPTYFYNYNGYSNLYKLKIKDEVISSIYPILLSGASGTYQRINSDNDNVYFSAIRKNKTLEKNATTGPFIYETQRSTFRVISSNEIAQEDATLEFTIPSEKVICNKDLESNILNSVNTYDAGGSVINTETHVFTIGSYSNKYYNLREAKYWIGNAYIMSYDKQRKTVKFFSFGDTKYASEFECAAVSGEYLLLGGSADKSAWFVKIALADII